MRGRIEINALITHNLFFLWYSCWPDVGQRCGRTLGAWSLRRSKSIGCWSLNGGMFEKFYSGDHSLKGSSVCNAWEVFDGEDVLLCLKLSCLCILVDPST